MGWEDTWIPEALRLFEGKTPVKSHAAETLLADRLDKETPNHRRLRLSVAYGRLREEAAPRAVEALRDELTQRGLMYDEWGSTTYSPFYCQGVGMITLLAAQRDDLELLRWCRKWWAAWIGLSAAVSVPIPRDPAGHLRVPGKGQPQGDLLQHGEVLGPGFRCKRERNRDNGILLRLLCGLETPWDRQFIERVKHDLDSQNSLNLLQLAYVDRLLSDGVLETNEYDPPRLARQVPKLTATLHVERWATGYRAWFDEAEGLGPVHFGILVDKRHKVYLDRDERHRNQKKPRKREADVPPPPVEPEVRLTIPQPSGEPSPVRPGVG
jgi:hypothetical protein